MFERLKQLFAPKRRGGGGDVEAQRPMGEGPAAAPVGPPTSGPAPAAPLNDPVADEPDRQQ